jgi:glycerophosphoryl diester phosphodiesterase
LLDVDLLSVPLDGVTPELVKTAHRAGQEIHVWNVNQEEDMRRMIAWGVDNLITDRPQVLRALLRA